MENKNKRQFLGIWIPRAIYLNKDLTWTEKILLVEIHSLDNEKGCFASNDYFAEFLAVTTTTISTSISRLKQMGLVKQISFDGRTRVLKADSKKFKSMGLKKDKSRVKEKLKDNKTKNITENKTLKKNIINKVLNDENLGINEKKKINDITSGAVCINVEDLKNESIWLEHCARYLQLSLHWVNTLLKQFIDEQQLKDDAFKSIKETKSHFLNWAKIEVAKNRKFGNDQWGRQTPQHIKPPKPKKEFVKPEISDAEKKRLHNKFLQDQLLKPYQRFIETGQFGQIQNFGGIVYKELEKQKLLFNDAKVINEIKKQIAQKKEQKKNGRGRLRNALQATMGVDDNKVNLEIELIKLTLKDLAEKKVDLESIVII